MAKENWYALWLGLKPRMLIFLEKLFWAALIALAVLVVLNLAMSLIRRFFQGRKWNPYKEKLQPGRNAGHRYGHLFL